MKTLESFQLAGKVALVTGAFRGIGQAIAIGLAEAGADVLLIDRIDCFETVQQIESLGKRAIAVRQDLAEMDNEKARKIINQAVDHFGGIDILVNNAGIIRRSPALEFSAEDWKAVLDINLNTVFYLSQAAARHFVDKHKPGKIINLASVLSFQGGLQVPAYTASKSGILGLTKALSNEWASQGINVNAIAPGYFKTEVTAGIRADPQRSAAMLERIPAGKWGELEDLKGPVVFLASAGADYLHGTVLSVDGGWLAR
ncbi:MAG: 2-deoxy-D-gluconate 3-dehydrogenase [Cyclobacteriaceae bacterium]|nr:MAG: 2-deoxy-D-gluconate 3-dehydrogenase [Cyclobacteriaceae bacterium]